MQVRRWRSAQHDVMAPFPVVWSTPPGDLSLRDVSLLSPHFLAVQALSDATQDPELVHLKLYRLEQTLSHHVATIAMQGECRESFHNTISCDTDIAPGEDGLVVVEVLSALLSLGCMYKPVIC